MTAFETWTCDWHADPPEEESHFVNEDQARDEGWVRAERRYTEDLILRAVAGLPERNLGPRTRAEIKHFCADCIKDPDCRAFIRDRGFRGYFDEDRERLDAAAA